MNANIREISQNDNQQVAALIRSVFEDMGIPKTGTAYADTSLNQMYEAYDRPRAFYFIIEEDGEVIGGGGIAPLDNYGGNVCELQKMYFLKEARGRGFGTKILDLCLGKAKEFGFDKCYLETMPYMDAARKLYEKNGFEYIDGPMGDTGHTSCSVWMLKTL
ncbi:GNAT family N-acetyltransferase [Allomuricauda sp. SCSIO 65647]|uniref:GNAT family N-acetyltransferase n=1 Tax=Allomuricauda sp. SCSIO 65647 TaxID=2908843 RepID=UPI001F213D4B|nr:GNAT family N-acetyltransferase [Muricauda sp. SCSIO 65647]UJH67613.1 GNAT family N-acetyltransferase [Muricauda sp. SCSIO 65647]